MSDSVITPGLQPESPVLMTLVDDQTQVFSPQFARGRTQRQIYSDPRWRMKLRFRGMRAQDRARLRLALAEARGKGVPLRVSPYQVQRGSFPSTELLTQSTEFTTTTGLASTSSASLSVQDRMLRLEVVRNDGSEAPVAYQTSNVGSAGVAYAARVALMAPTNDLLYMGLYVGGFDTAPAGDGYVIGGRGLTTVAGVLTGASSPQAIYYNIPGHIAGDVVLIPYMSFARCALLSAGQNYLLNSADFAGSGWSSSAATISTNVVLSPLGNLAGDSITDTGANTVHYVEQSYATVSAAEPWNFSVALRVSTRQWGYIQIYSNGGSVFTYFDLVNGVLGTGSGTGTWSGRTRGIAPMGNGWYRVSISGLKPAGDTAVVARIATAGGDTVSSYVGDGSSFYLWGATLSRINLPTELVLTTSAVAPGGATGSTVGVTGLPASTEGLLLPGDFVEINGELKQVVAPLNSAADGVGKLQFRPALGTAAAHGDAVIVKNPMGTFTLATDPEISSMFGTHDEVELDLIEVYP